MLYQPRHAHPYLDLGERMTRAKCSSPEPLYCAYAVCPRHQPEAYASHMARHATDSLPPEAHPRETGWTGL